MHGIKGFSLLEVLLSLLLITSVSLGLLEQQRQTKQLMRRIIRNVIASQAIEQRVETNSFAVQRSF